MIKFQREDIHIISRHSNISEKSIDTILKKNVYNSKESWHKFLRLFFISLGVCFTTAGILFFFAYNWANLHKFIKIGLIEALIIITTSIALFSKANSDIKNILLTGASMLVGVLFAVFGQVYQTGANAYDFFLGWTMAITLWAFIANFPPLSLLFIVLVNTTLILYFEQVVLNGSYVFLYTLLFIINVLFLMAFLFGNKFYEKLKIPTWFLNIIALGAISFSTIGIIAGIFEREETTSLLLSSLLITVLLYTLGIRYGLKTKSSFFISIISFSTIIIISSFLIKLSHDEAMFFLIGLFIIGSVTFVIKTLINLQKKWINS